MKSKIIPNLFIVILLALILSACGGGSDASTSVEAYFEALVAKDATQLINLSCAAWESGAQTELDGFGGVETALEGLSCQVSGTDGEYTTVAGLVLDRFGRIPTAGEAIEVDGFGFEIVRMDRNRVDRVRVTRGIR